MNIGALTATTTAAMILQQQTAIETHLRNAGALSPDTAVALPRDATVYAAQRLLNAGVIVETTDGLWFVSEAATAKRQASRLRLPLMIGGVLLMVLGATIAAMRDKVFG